MKNSNTLQSASLVQGVYFLVTGIWPILSEQTFEKVTGPKVDFWLVKTLGALISVVGGVLVMAGLRKGVDRQTSTLAIGSAVALGASDIVYAAKRRISPVYLLDALAELGLIILWVIGMSQRREDP